MPVAIFKRVQVRVSQRPAAPRHCLQFWRNMHFNTNGAMERDYETAIRIMNDRRRPKRPSHSTQLESQQTSGVNHSADLKGTPSIDGMSEWFKNLGHSPDDLNRLNVVHIAGTKGKGSTCAFTESFLRAHGHRTGFPRKIGLYTSPHLMIPEERIRLNFQPLTQDSLAKYFFEVYDRLPQLATEYDLSKKPAERGPRYLQLFALVAMHVFIREAVDVAIFETHCGGEFDATNIIQRPIVTAITTLGMDHVDMLGPTMSDIAWHKAGIFKEGAIALTVSQNASRSKILNGRAAEKGVQLKYINDDHRLPLDAPQLEPAVQRMNASLALSVAEAALSKMAPREEKITEGDISAGVEQFSWPGRFQIVHDGPHIWYLDSAHNDLSVEIAAQWFAQMHAGKTRAASNLPCVLIFSHVNELRDAVNLLRTLGRALFSAGVHISHVIFTSYKHRGIGPHVEDFISFRKAWRELDSKAELWDEGDIGKALMRARRSGNEGMHTLITGSQHLVGPALQLLQQDQNNSAMLSL